MKKNQKPETRVFRFKGAAAPSPLRGEISWDGVKKTAYKTSGEGAQWAGVSRQAIVAGERGEKTRFHLRYFELAPGGRTCLESHRHEHVVVVIKGKGKVRLGRRTRQTGFMDIIYIEPGIPHRLSNPYKEPFGFFCTVDARRDRPRVIMEKIEMTPKAR